MIDVKKLITGFLILTALAGTFALAMPGLYGPSSNISLSANIQSSATGATAAPLAGTNAYAPVPLTDLTDLNVPSVDANALNSDPNNLTNNFAASLVNRIADANPNGSATDDGGNPTITAPDTNAVLADLGNSQALQNFTPPDWDIEAASQPLHITADSSAQNVLQYATALGNALQKNFTATGLPDLSNGSSSIGDPSFVASGVGNALNDVAQLPVPSIFANFQKSLVRVLVYEKNVMALAQNPGNDPVKSAITLQLEQSRYDSAIADFSKEAQKVQALKSFSLNAPTPKKTNGALAFIQEFLGVPTAHAQFVVSDPVLEAQVALVVANTATTAVSTNLTLGQIIWKYAQEILLQVLKNSLVIAVQNNILKFTQNGNAPRFVQQLGGLMLNAFNTVGIKELNKTIPALYPAYQNSSRATLSQLFQPFTPTAIVTSLEFAVGNRLGQWVGNFTKSGNSWAAYGATLLPSGNYYGSLFMASQIAGAAAIRQGGSGGTVQNEFSASNGFWPIQKCTDNSTPNPKDGNMCDDGKPAVTLTPGQTINQLVNSATGSDVHLIVNAQSLVALAATILTTLLSKLTNGFTLSSAGVSGGATIPPPPPLPLTCSPTVETLPFTFLSSNGVVNSTFGASGGPYTGTGLPATYTWSAGSAAGVTANPATSTGYTFNPIYTVPGPGTYNLTVTVTASTGGNSTCALQIIAS